MGTLPAGNIHTPRYLPQYIRARCGKAALQPPPFTPITMEWTEDSPYTTQVLHSPHYYFFVIPVGHDITQPSHSFMPPLFLCTVSSKQRSSIYTAALPGRPSFYIAKVRIIYSR